MTFKHAVVVAILLFPCGVLRAADGSTVEAIGEAQIKNGDEVEAKKAATADALKKCIEQVVGISIQSDFSSEQKETVKNNQSDFDSKVRDSLVQHAEGFIQKYDVLDTKIDGTVMKVKVRALVFESKIRAEIKKLADLITAAGNPKLMLVVQEITIGTDGSRRLAAESLVGAYLEKELLARGFEIRGQKSARSVAGKDQEAYDRWLDDLAGAATMARQQGADILIAGRVEIRDNGPIEDTAGMDALKGQIRINISSVVRGLNAATGEVLSTKPVQMVSLGTTQERAVQRALQGRGKNLIEQTFEQMLEDLKTSFQKTADQGQSYVVQLSGIKSFKTQGKTFLGLLGAIKGVASAQQKSFASGTLIVDLLCKCSAAELQERIFSAAGKDSGLSTIDIEAVSGKNLAFKL